MEYEKILFKDECYQTQGVVFGGYLKWDKELKVFYKKHDASVPAVRAFRGYKKEPGNMKTIEGMVLGFGCFVVRR